MRQVVCGPGNRVYLSPKILQARAQRRVEGNTTAQPEPQRARQVGREGGDACQVTDRNR